MGGWNRSRYVTGHRDRSAGASRRSLPSPDYGDGHYPVPLWEREFCCHVGNITWERFCENKQFVGPFHKHEPWDDSEAFYCFQNAKARFWAHYHGKPSDIPLLDDPDLYIDKVDHQCKLDPELIAELDSVGLPFEDDTSAPATGLANAGADNKCTQNGSGNWDVFIEKPAEVNKWESEANLAPDTTWEGQANLVTPEAVWGGQANVVTPEAVWGGQSSNKWGNNSLTSWGAPLEKPAEVNKWESEANLAPDTTWEGQANVVTPEAVWGDQANVVTPEAVWGGQSNNKWGNNTSWDAPLEKPSWQSWSKNHYTSNNWNNFHGGPSNNRYQQLEDPSYTSGSGRRRNSNGGGGGGGGGYFKQRSNKQSYQAEGQHQQQRNSGWQQDQRGRNRQWRPVHNRAS